MKSYFDQTAWKSPDRQRDERDLQILRRHENGETARSIGATYGMTPEYVRTLINRIKGAMA